MNVGEAKTNLSKLLEAALRGEDVVIARNGVPAVRLVPVAQPPLRRLGFIPLHVPDAVFSPLEDADLEGWS